MEKNNIKVLSDNVLVEIDKEEMKTQSGLIIASNKEQGDMKIGVVKVAGNGRYENGEFIKSEVKEGDKIAFQYGADVHLEGKQYVLVKGSDVLVVIENE